MYNYLIEIYDNMTTKELFYTGNRLIAERIKLLDYKRNDKTIKKYSVMLDEEYRIVEKLIYDRVLKSR